jgi:hypothetical protein
VAVHLVHRPVPARLDQRRQHVALPVGAVRAAAGAQRRGRLAHKGAAADLRRDQAELPELAVDANRRQVIDAGELGELARRRQLLARGELAGADRLAQDAHDPLARRSLVLALQVVQSLFV